jgi:plasmid maintenance system antidote protein VapI
MDDRDWTIAPGETLRDWCEETHLPHKAAATACGRMPIEMFERILSGKQRITKTIAEALEHGTGIPATLWRNLESGYRADLKAGRKDTTAPHGRRMRMRREATR